MQQPVTIFYASFRGWQSNHHDHVCMFNKLDDSYLLVYCGFIGNFDSLIVVRAADLCTHRALTSSTIVYYLLSGCLYPLENFVQLNCLLSIALSPPPYVEDGDIERCWG